jgi:DNA-binding LacI/PurR family transcriptional regulator
MVTMREVAEHAGVSIATVSFVLNDTKPVTPSTRARIERSMAELGFRRNAVARALASRRTRIIALVHPVVDRLFISSSLEFMISAAEEAGRLGYHLVIWPAGNDGNELRELLGQGLVDGVLLMEVQLDDQRIGVLSDTATPFALIGRSRDHHRYSYVDIDFDTSTRQAVDHLYGLGHREIVLVLGSQHDEGFQSYGPYVRTEESYRAVAAELGLTVSIMEFEHTVASGQGLADRLLTEHPEVTAVLMINEYATLGMLPGLRRHGRRVPEDISVVSMLSSSAATALWDPPLTFMHSPGTELGRLGAEALVRLLEDNEPLRPRLVPCTFEAGGSTAPPRAS